MRLFDEDSSESATQCYKHLFMLERLYTLGISRYTQLLYIIRLFCKNKHRTFRRFLGCIAPDGFVILFLTLSKNKLSAKKTRNCPKGKDSRKLRQTAVVLSRENEEFLSHQVSSWISSASISAPHIGMLHYLFKPSFFTQKNLAVFETVWPLSNRFPQIPNPTHWWSHLRWRWNLFDVSEPQAQRPESHENHRCLPHDILFVHVCSCVPYCLPGDGNSQVTRSCHFSYIPQSSHVINEAQACSALCRLRSEQSKLTACLV